MIYNCAVSQTGTLLMERIDSIVPVRGLSIAAPRPAELDAFIKFIDDELAPRKVNTLILRVDYNY